MSMHGHADLHGDQATMAVAATPSLVALGHQHIHLHEYNLLQLDGSMEALCGT